MIVFINHSLESTLQASTKNINKNVFSLKNVLLRLNKYGLLNKVCVGMNKLK